MVGYGRHLRRTRRHRHHLGYLRLHPPVRMIGGWNATKASGALSWTSAFMEKSLQRLLDGSRPSTKANRPIDNAEQQQNLCCTRLKTRSCTRSTAKVPIVVSKGVLLREDPSSSTMKTNDKWSSSISAAHSGPGTCLQTSSLRFFPFCSA